MRRSGFEFHARPVGDPRLRVRLVVTRPVSGNLCELPADDGCSDTSWQHAECRCEAKTGKASARATNPPVASSSPPVAVPHRCWTTTIDVPAPAGVSLVRSAISINSRMLTQLIATPGRARSRPSDPPVWIVPKSQRVPVQAHWNHARSESTKRGSIVGTHADRTGQRNDAFSRGHPLATGPTLQTFGPSNTGGLPPGTMLTAGGRPGNAPGSSAPGRLHGRGRLPGRGRQPGAC